MIQKKVSCDLVVGNAYIVTMDGERRIFAKGAVAVGATRILAVGDSQTILAEYEPEKYIDAHGAVVTPGFIDSHTHVSLTTIRDLFNDVPSESEHANQEIANTYHDYVEALTDEDEYASSLLASAELLLNGYTAVMDPGTVFEPECAAKAMEVVGIRGSLGEPFLIDRVATQTSGHSRAPLGRKRCEKLLGSQLWRNSDPESLVKGHVAIYGMGSNSIGFTLEAIQFAQQERVAFTQHLSTAPDDYLDFIKECDGLSPLVSLEQAGIFNEDNSALNFVHCNLLGVLGTSPPQITLRPQTQAWQGFQECPTFSVSQIHRSAGLKSPPY